MTENLILSFSEAPPRVSEWKRFWRVFFQRKLVMIGLIILLILVIAAIFAPWLAPHDPYRGEMRDALSHPSWKYFLGTDIQGRATFSRLIYGARMVLIVGFITVGVAAVLGVILGIAAGFYGGILNMIRSE